MELALAGAKQITIVNRTTARGRELVKLLNEKTKTSANFVEWDGKFEVPPETDILVNATSIGLFPDIEAKPNIAYGGIRSEMIVCDVIPNPPDTAFLREAEARGAITLNGLGMLVYQGAIGFTMWTGLEAPVDAMYEALKREFE